MLSMPQGFVSAPRVITSALGAGIGRVGVVFGFLLFAMVFFAVLGIQLVGNAGDYHNRSFSPPLKTCMRLQVFLFLGGQSNFVGMSGDFHNGSHK
jgi:hypothetical protein